MADIKIGNLEIDNLKVGTLSVDALYIGDVKIYPSTPPTPTYQWVLYQEGDTVPDSFVYGVKLYLGLAADNEIDFQDSHEGGGINFIYSADADSWYGIDGGTSNEIDLSSYYDSSEGCYTVLFSDLGYGGYQIIYPADQFEFDIQLYESQPQAQQ